MAILFTLTMAALLIVVTDDGQTTTVANCVMTSPNFRQLLKLHGIDDATYGELRRNRFVLSYPINLTWLLSVLLLIFVYVSLVRQTGSNQRKGQNISTEFTQPYIGKYFC